MTRLVDGDVLLEKFAKLEAIALEYVSKLNERQDPDEHDMWVMWTGILNERTAYKYEIVDAPTVDAEPHWIPCSERLPKAGEIVLVCGKKGGIYTAIYSKPRVNWNNGWWKLNSKSHYCDPEAWMPLPKPYEVEK